MSQETVERVFKVTSPASLTLANINGSVQILPGDDGEVKVSAVKHLDHGNAERTQIIIEQLENEQVSVKTHFAQNGIKLFHNRPCDVDYFVHMPKSSNVDVSGVSCTQSMEGLEGELKLVSVSGEIKVHSLKGKLKASTVSGNVSGDQLSGSLKFNAVSGDIRLSDSNLTTVRGNTVSGNIHLQSPLGEGPYKFDSVSGDIYLSVPAGTHCTVETHSLSGDAKIQLPVTSQHRSNGIKYFEVAGGGVGISLNSVSGDLHLEGGTGRSVPEALVVESAPPPVEKPAPSSTQEILAKIERGDITVDEGITLLSKS